MAFPLLFRRRSGKCLKPTPKAPKNVEKIVAPQAIAIVQTKAASSTKSRKIPAQSIKFREKTLQLTMVLGMSMPQRASTSAAHLLKLILETVKIMECKSAAKVVKTINFEWYVY